jgi:hypothetical protein
MLQAEERFPAEPASQAGSRGAFLEWRWMRYGGSPIDRGRKINAVSLDFFCARFAALRPVELKKRTPAQVS